MAEAQRFECPGRYFGRYCTDEREYNYARILERDNRQACKGFENYGEESRKLREEIEKILENIEKQNL